MNNIIPVIIGIVAGILITIAASIPGWIVMKYPRAGYSSYVSLFYGLTCSDYCQVYSYGEIYNYDDFTNVKGRFWMIEFQVEVLLSIVITIVSVIFLCLFRRGCKSPTLLLTTLLLFVIGGLIILYACGRILNATLAKNSYVEIKEDADYILSFPFSLVPAGIGGVLQIIAAIVVYIIRGQVMN